MSFEDKPFILLVLATYLIWLCVRKNEPRAVILLLTASILFYGHNHWKLLPILLSYCFVNWWVGYRLELVRRKRGLLTLGIVFNLVILCFYKYTRLISISLNNWFEIEVLNRERIAHWSIPFGISFYAFTGIAYMVDVYRGTAAAQRDLTRYTLSAIFFPHLVAGPILRPNEFLESLRPGQMPQQSQATLEAFWLLARGYFKKVVIADRLAIAIDPFFQHVADPTTEGAWSLPFVYLYALQIYFDFSAYTDLARGFGLLFGYRWPDNFNLPYLATNIADFWRRWHITLSRFLRDYLYIPLGGNRGSRWRTSFNLMVTMLLGGLWHGASWSFMIWGGLHGTYLVVHRFWKESYFGRTCANWTGPLQWLWSAVGLILTFHAVCLAWCFFRLTDWNHSLICIQKWFVFDSAKMWDGGALEPSLWIAMLGYAMILLLLFVVQKIESRKLIDSSVHLGFQWGLRVAMLILAVVLSPGGESAPFIYFQF